MVELKLLRKRQENNNIGVIVMKKDKLIGAIIAFILLASISLGLWMCVGMIICWVFGLTFSAKVVFGLWLTLMLVRNLL